MQRQAFEFNEGEYFWWKHRRYRVVREYNYLKDRDEMLVREDGVANDQAFNPYCLVEDAETK